MCREGVEGEAPEIGQYTVKYCLTRNCRSGEVGKMGKNKTRLIMVSIYPSPAHTATYCRSYFFYIFFSLVMQIKTAAADAKV